MSVGMFRLGALNCTAMSRPESGYGSGFSNTRCTTVKIVAFAPIASASVSTVASVNAELRISRRAAWRISRPI